MLRVAPVLFLAMLLSLLLNREGGFRLFEARALDLEMRLRSAVHPTQQSNVALVLITDPDYRKLFEGQSPLDPQELGKLIEAVATANPKVIGIDIDTSQPAFRALEVLSTNLKVPVVWAQTAVFSHRAHYLRVSDVLGRDATTQAGTGLVVFKLDPDGALRRYQRVYQTDKGLRPSLPWALASVTRKDRNRGGVEQAEEERFVDFDVAFQPIVLPAARVLALATAEGWRTDSPLQGKTVLIGGDYAVQDEHDTPLGWKLGVEILAQIVDTELALPEGGRKAAESWVLFPLQLCGGILLLLLFHLVRLSRALLLSVVALPLLALLSSVLAYWTPSRWGYFLPALLGIVLQELFVGTWEIRRTLLAKASHELTREDGPEPKA